LGAEGSVLFARSGHKLSRRSFVKLAGWTFFGTLGCLVVSLLYNYLSFRTMSSEALRQGMISATVLPIVLAGPLFCFLTMKLRELAIVNHKLNDLASIDAMTRCLNRRAFTAGVERLLDARTQDDAGGALLVIDADRFKLVNDLHGHDAGDEALRLVADAIRSAVRDSDLVGRLGGEEFGVFLWRTPQQRALEVAERIRAAVANAEFRPKGARHHLSVSIGCAVATGGVDFDALFRAADLSLYEAKRNGRNRIELAVAPGLAPDLLDLAS
jgi:diguanylate cyclase